MTSAARARLERMRRRRHAAGHDDDPAAGLVNLFDLWMVFAVAVLVTAVGASRDELRARAAARRLEQQVTPSERELSGRGERLGVAYRLASGEVVYVPDGSVAPR